MPEERKGERSDVEQLAGILQQFQVKDIVGALQSRLIPLNQTEDLWTRFTLSELRKLTSLTQQEIRAHLPLTAAQILIAQAKAGQAVGLRAGDGCGDCCWQICHWNL